MSEIHIVEKLSAYCLEALSPDETRCVAEHLIRCQECRSEYEQIRLGVRFAQQLTMERAPDSLWGEIQAKLNEAHLPEAHLPEAHLPEAHLPEAHLPEAHLPEAHLNAAQNSLTDAGNATDSVRLFTPKRSGFAAPRWQMAVAASVALLLLAGAWSVWQRRAVKEPTAHVPEWKVASLQGQPRIGTSLISDDGKLKMGESVITDSASRAQIQVGEIGEVEIGPDSQVKFIAAQQDNHRLALSRGKMRALIWAPPRQFYVDTPSAVAVDLGCAYTLEVNDDGESLLNVEMGWVAFEWQGRESFVPADAACVTRPGAGPGTPYFNDASETFRNALHSFDTAGSDASAREVALKNMLKLVRKRDGLTLWHLLTRTTETQRAEVYDRMAALIAPPAGITRAGILRGDKKMLDAWWEKLDLGSADFWREWKGPVPK
jgi:hypothetical protein